MIRKLWYSIEIPKDSNIIILEEFALHLLKKHGDFGELTSKDRIDPEKICKAVLIKRRNTV